MHHTRSTKTPALLVPTCSSWHLLMAEFFLTVYRGLFNKISIEVSRLESPVVWLIPNVCCGGECTMPSNTYAHTHTHTHTHTDIHILMLSMLDTRLYLYINTLTLGAIWQHLLQGADIHSPLSTFLRLLAPVASDLPTGEVFKKPQR